MSGKHFLILWLLPVVLLSCSKDAVEEPVDDKPQLVTLQVPNGFPAPVVNLDNPLTKEGIELGRKLFYDKSISLNRQVSCASCHNQKLAFTDGVSLASHGVSGKKLSRHSPSLINMLWMDSGFFWDGGSKNLESQAFGPISHADEMGMSFKNVVSRLKEKGEYIHLFSRAFEDGITIENVAKSLAQFQRTLISADAKYDRYKRGEDNVELTLREIKGMQLVQTLCGSCHKGELFTDNRFHNNGLDNDFSDESEEWLLRGRYRISFDLKDMGAYKTPTLRNIMLTAPYMHDGRFATIEDVLHHYADGVSDSEFTSRLLYNNTTPGIPLTSQDKEDIMAFLHTLTDEKFITNRAFGQPD